MKKLAILMMIFILPLTGAASHRIPIKANIKSSVVKDKQKSSSNKSYSDWSVHQLEDQIVGTEVTYYFDLEVLHGLVPGLVISNRTLTVLGSSDITHLSDECAGTTTLVCRVYFTVQKSSQGVASIMYLMNLDASRPDLELLNESYYNTINLGIVRNPADDKNQTKCPGSIFRPDTQSVGEEIEIIGSPASLMWSSSYANEYLAYYKSISRSSSFYPEGWNISLQHQYDRSLKRLFRGTGQSEPLEYQNVGVTDYVVSSQGDEVYVFNYLNGRHLQTLKALTGAVKYSFNYDGSNRLASIVDGFGNQTTINRDGSGVLTSITSPYGQVTNISLNGSGLISSVTNPNGKIYAMTYKSGTELLETFTKPEGQVSAFVYDSDGRLSQDISSAGNGWTISQNTTSTGIVSVSSQVGRTTTSEHFPGKTYVKKVTDSTGMVSQYENREDGTIINANPIIRTELSVAEDPRFGYLNKVPSSLVTKMDGISNTTTYSHSVSGFAGLFSYGSLTDTQTVSGRTTTNVFNKSAMTNTTTSHEGAVLSVKLDSNELPIEVKVGNDTKTDLTYDSYGRLTNTIQGTKDSTTFAYNTAGFVQSITNALSEITSFTYDLAGRVLTKTLPDLRVISYSYDDNGNLVSVTPPSRPSHGLILNVKELLDTYSPPTLTGLSVKNTTYAYNQDKQLTQITRPDSAVINFTYNVTTGLLTTLGLPTGNYSYTYKTGAPMLDVVSSPDDFNNTFSWYGRNVKSDAQKQISTGNLFGKVTFSYDVDHRLSARTIQGRSGATTYTQNYTYNNDSQPTQIGDMTYAYSYPSGRLSTTTLGKISDSRTYDTYGKLATYTAIYTPTSGSPSTLYSYTLTRDNLHRITSKSETLLGVTDVYTYSYDSAGRLTQVLKNSAAYSSYTYDNNSNRTSGTTAGVAFTATYDDQDRILTYNTRSFTYNANGDLSQIQWTPTTSSSYVYDAIGSLKQVTLTGGDVLAYKYDGMNRRIRKLENSTFKSQYFYENGERIAAHVNNSGVIQKEYVYGVEHVNSPDYMVASSVKYRILKDHLGSPRLVVDVSNGTVSQRMDYNELGEVINDTNQGFQHYGFAGGIYDGQSKLVKFGARDYDPRFGRWLAKDPIRFDGEDTNLYGYVLQDPVNFVDPDGEEAIAIGVGLGIVGDLLLGGSAVGTGALINELLDFDPVFNDPGAMCDAGGEEPKGGHSNNQRPSNRSKHEKGDSRRRQDQGGDKKRSHPKWQPRNPKKK